MEALASAKISAEHTATTGWSQLYLGHRHRQQEERRKLAKELKTLAIALEDRGLTADEEKEVGNIKKSSEAMRDADMVFHLQTVGPVREPVTICDRIRSEAMNEARRLESEAPMMHIGLEGEMSREVGGVDRPAWNAETGCVVIGPA